MNMLSMIKRPRGQKPSENGSTTAVVVPFPRNGEALLVKLVDDLRGRFGDKALESESFQLVLSRSPMSRLTIDRAACVEFLGERAGYRLAIDVSPDTVIVLETVEFDMVDEFVGEYIAARLAEGASLGLIA